MSPIRRTRTGAPLELVAAMDEVPGVTLTDVALPREPAPDPSSRSVQGTVDPALVRHYGPASHPLRVAELPGARLLGSGGVVTGDGRLVLESLWDQEHLRRDFAPPPALPQPVRLEGRVASLISLWDDNYFHWLFNALPRLAVLRASGVPYDRLLVPEPLAPFQRASLERLGIPPARLAPFRGRHVECEALIWAAPLAPINEPSAYLLEWVRDALGEPERTPHRRLYLSRRGRTRRAVNESELFAALQPLGFELIVPDQLPFEEQVRLFAETRIAVGPHGSNFTGGVFSDRLSALECFQPAHVNWGVYSVLCAAGVDHWSLVCPSVHQFRQERRFDGMRVPVDLVLETVRRIEAEL